MPAGTPVLAVTGGYLVTVTDGVATENFGDAAAAQPEIKSFHDLLQALAGSSLVEVAGVVAADRTVGGQAAVDVPLRTQAWLLALGGKVRLQDVVVPAGGPTQALVVRCINDDTVGAERWSVAGDVSGALPVATTGQPYVSAAAQFTVPRIDPAALGSGRWSFKYAPAAREESEGVPSVCLRPFRLGRNAVARTVTFRYVKRPPADCSCADMATPVLSLTCLGLEGSMDIADSKLRSRLEAVYAWREAFVRANTAVAAGSADNPTVYTAARFDLDFMESALPVVLGCLRQVYGHAAALAQWDALWTEVQADLAHLMPGGNQAADTGVGVPVQTRSTADPRFLDRWRAACDNILLAAGLLPKSESSGSDAGGCWTDHGGTHWWVDVEGHFLPAFTNQAYVGARRDSDTGRPYSTMEFGFGLVVACPERLRVGDEVTVRIESVDGERPYRVGDEAIIQTIGAGPAWLAGGVDGTDVQTWRVVGDVAGQLPDYVVPTNGAPVPPWGGAGITLQLAPGGIPFALGDAFSLAVEAGQYQWRRHGGAWSAVADIPADGVAALDDGLVAHFDAGAAPSFVPDDAYAFAVHQPWASSHVQSAQASAWGWAGATATLVLDFGGVQPLGAVALARYALPAGAVVSCELSDDGTVWAPPTVLDTSGRVCVQFIDAAARYLRLVVTGAAGGHIGWLWAGQPLATDHHASGCQRRRRWAARRGDGINAASLYAGVGDGWALAWEPGDAQSSRLLDSDVAALVALADWAQVNDEPLLFVPHVRHPQDAALVRLGQDALEVSDVHEWQSDDASQRLLSATLELEPVYA